MSDVSARMFNQAPSKVKAVADKGLTDRGEPAVVALSSEDDERPPCRGSIRDSLRMEVDVDIEPVVSPELGQVAEL